MEKYCLHYRAFNSLYKKETENDIYFDNIFAALACWSESKAREEAVYAWIVRYTDENTPGVLMLDLNFNKLAEKEIDKPYLRLK